MSIIEIKLGELNDQEIIKGLNEEIAYAYDLEFDRLVKKIKPRLESLIRSNIEGVIKNSFEYLALMPGGKLYGQIGNPKINSDVDTIIDFIKNYVNVEMIFNVEQGARVDIIGNLAITILPDYATLISHHAAKFTTEKGQVLPWLRWLLLEGETNIVIGYYYVENTDRRKSISSFSRTGTGIMRKRGEPKSFKRHWSQPYSPKNWSVPPEFAGTENDNWFTRAFKGIEVEVALIVEREFNKLD